MTSATNQSPVFLAEGAMQPRLETSLHSVYNWCEYAVWGMTLHDDQTPWLALIECFQILHHLGRAGGEIFPGLGRTQDGALEHEHVRYSVPRNLNLRHLLFRDREVARLATQRPTDHSGLWRELSERSARMDPAAPLRLDYLREHFDDFHRFAQALELLRSTEVDGFNAKRWTSRHLLPLGPSMLFADVDDAKLSPDKRFFRRTGEILYLMLNRSEGKLRKRLEELIGERLIQHRHPLGQIAEHMAGPKQGESTEGEKVELATGYLPIPHMDVYDRLAEDWISLLSLKGVPLETLLDPLMRLSALHQIVYAVKRASDVSGTEAPPFVLDLTGSARRSPVQRLANDQYEHHQILPRRAVESLLDRFAESPKWTELLSHNLASQKAYQCVKRHFLWPRGSEPIASALQDPEKHLTALLSDFQSTNSHTVWSFMSAHAKRCGMLVARRRAGTWYAPNESFLEALVLANVRGAMEFGQFLQILHRRYNIVIGTEQARTSFDVAAMSLEPFKANQLRFEERLAVLGYIDRKSDDCAFVINPFDSNGGGVTAATSTGEAA